MTSSRNTTSPGCTTTAAHHSATPAGTTSSASPSMTSRSMLEDGASSDDIVLFLHEIASDIDEEEEAQTAVADPAPDHLCDQPARLAPADGGSPTVDGALAMTTRASTTATGLRRPAPEAAETGSPVGRLRLAPCAGDAGERSCRGWHGISATTTTTEPSIEGQNTPVQPGSSRKEGQSHAWQAYQGQTPCVKYVPRLVNPAIGPAISRSTSAHPWGYPLRGERFLLTPGVSR